MLIIIITYKCNQPYLDKKITSVINGNKIHLYSNVIINFIDDVINNIMKSHL